jgi:hypothetical protein
MAGGLNRLVSFDNGGQDRGTQVPVVEPMWAPGDLAEGNRMDEFDNDPDNGGGALGDSPAKVCAPEG